MDISIFEFKDYQEYLRVALPTKGELRGVRSKLASQIGCRVSHITQGIQGESLFSLEIAEKIAGFLALTDKEKDYFINLVSLARSGTSNLRSYYQEKIDNIQKEHLLIKSQISSDKPLDLEYARTYYKSWHYAAAHILASLPTINSIHEIAKTLRIDVVDTKNIVDFLINAGILKKENNQITTTGKKVTFNQMITNILICIIEIGG